MRGGQMRMHKLIEYFDDLGILSTERLENFVWNSELYILIDTAKYIRNIVNESFVPSEYSPFSFVPSVELSGVGGCNEISCKLERAQNFSLFSSLYADNVYITLSFITSMHFEDTIEDIGPDDYEYRYRLWCDFSIICVYADLINADIIKIAPIENSYCPNCFQKHILNLNNPVDLSEIKRYYDDVSEMLICDKDKKMDTVTISVRNMDDFFTSHDGVVDYPYSLLSLLEKDERKKGSLIKNHLVKSGIINDLVNDTFSEICLNSYCCNQMESKYITSKTVDGILMEMTYTAKKAHFDKRKSANVPFYDLPIISEAPIKTILQLREVENDAFNRYRIALNKAVQENYSVERGVQVKEIYDDIIYPAFQHLDERLHNIKTGVFKKTFAAIAITSSVIFAGTYSGIIKNNLSDILTAIGGTSVLTGAGIKTFDGLLNRNQKLKENDYYFIWKLKEASKR